MNAQVLIQKELGFTPNEVTHYLRYAKKLDTGVLSLGTEIKFGGSYDLYKKFTDTVRRQLQNMDRTVFELKRRHAVSGMPFVDIFYNGIDNEKSLPLKDEDVLQGCKDWQDYSYKRGYVTREKISEILKTFDVTVDEKESRCNLLSMQGMVMEIVWNRVKSLIGGVK